MENVVGIFAVSDDAYEALENLRRIGITRNQVNILLPGAIPHDITPVSDAEQPGMGATIGAVVGGVTGAFAGLSIVALTIPTVGVVTAIGLAAATAAGMIGGAAAGSALEEVDNGLPADEIYVYEDALRKGRTVVVVQASDHAEAARIRKVFAYKHAESLDSARDQWWTGLRGAEQARYDADGRNFSSDEVEYRRGFEAAQHPAVIGKSYSNAASVLKSLYPHEYRLQTFRDGYERGRRHREQLIADADRTDIDRSVPFASTNRQV